MSNPVNNRQSMRLKNYDYSSTGAYFVTILSYERTNIFGRVRESSVVLNDLGRVVKNAWELIPDHFNEFELDSYVIMPNHLHGIIHIQNEKHYKDLTYNQFQQPTRKSVSTVIQAFKATVTREARKESMAYHVWQRNFYEHVIRTDKELYKCQEYIQNNPLKWTLDRNNRESLKYQKKGTIY